MDRSSARQMDDGGFTLIELMVVVLIIAVLLAIAIPTFLGARNRANDRAVESNVRNAFSAVRVYYTDRMMYTADPAAMQGVEPSLAWTNAALDGTQPPNTIHVEVRDVPLTGQTVIVAGRSKAGRCYFLRDVMNGATTGTHYQAKAPVGGSCDVPADADPSWDDAWPS
jgi:type IV pilus assembly protein PilA